MQSWQADAILLSVARHGESGAILRLLTEDHGLFGAYVRGGGSKRQRGFLQIGNTLSCTWQARVADHLGSASVELVQERAAIIMEDGDRLAGLNAVTAITLAALPERVPYPVLYQALGAVLDLIALEAAQMHDWAAAIARYELGLLEVLGFGLDFSQCAATGGNNDLIYVSPKSGRAVSAAAGEPYKDRLLNLPKFLISGEAARLDEIDRALRLTGYFLEHHVLAAKSAPMPDARGRFIARLTRDKD